MIGITNTRLIKAGVRFCDFRAAGQLYQINNKAGVLHDHHFQSTVTDLQTPVYNSAPIEIRTRVLALKGPRANRYTMGAGLF